MAHGLSYSRIHVPDVASREGAQPLGRSNSPLAAYSLPCSETHFGVVAGTSVTGDFQSGTYHFPGGTIPDGQTTSST